MNDAPMVRTDAVVDEATRSAEVMLREVLAGDTYDEVARVNAGQEPRLFAGEVADFILS
jgi:hypothetical protein